MAHELLSKENWSSRVELVLERLTKPFAGLESNESTGEFGTGEVDVVAPFAAQAQSSKPVEPSEGALYGPAVASQLLTGLDTTTGNAALAARLRSASRHLR